MAVSLRDKLRAVDSPKPKPAPAVTRQGLLTREALFPLEDFPHLFKVTAQTLARMDKEGFPSAFDPYRVLYLDTETTGLSTGAGTIAFLTGVGFLTGQGFVVRQFLMRDYCDENELLTCIAALLKDFDILVTFNGATFDLPLLRTRFLMNRMDASVLDLPHADLLHMARRIFKLRLKKCNLSYLEEAVFGMPRVDDLPGSLIPERYFTYLKTGQLCLLDDILDHNRQDIASLCRLLSHMAHMYDHPDKVPQLEDVYSIGVALEKRRYHDQARRCYHLAASGPDAGLSLARLGQSYRRANALDEAVSTFEEMIARQKGGVTPYIELAKLYEHRLRDLEKAVFYTKKAMMMLSEPTLFDDSAVHEERFKVQYRYDRLMRKQKKAMR